MSDKPKRKRGHPFLGISIWDQIRLLRGVYYSAILAVVGFLLLAAILCVFNLSSDGVFPINAPVTETVSAIQTINASVPILTPPTATIIPLEQPQ